MDYLELRRDVIERVRQLREKNKGILQFTGCRLPMPPADMQRYTELVHKMQDLVFELHNDPIIVNIARSETQFIRVIAQSQRIMESILDTQPLRHVLRPRAELVRQHESFEEPLVTVDTAIPPEVPLEISPVVVATYMQQLKRWIDCVAYDLWGEDNSLELPQIGSKYIIADLPHMYTVITQLRRLSTGRENWQSLMRHKAAEWNSTEMCITRAYFIRSAELSLRTLLKPDSVNPADQFMTYVRDMAASIIGPNLQLVMEGVGDDLWLPLDDRDDTGGDRYDQD